MTPKHAPLATSVNDGLGLNFTMLPGSPGDTQILPKAQLRTPAKPHSVEDVKELHCNDDKNEARKCDVNARTSPSIIQAGEVSPALPLFYLPRRRAVSPYRPNSERADLKLQELIYHYTTIVAALTVTPVGPRHEWFPFAAVDEALFHAVMSHTAAHSAYLRKVPLQNEAEYFWHTGQAIRLVNFRLGEGLYKAATDGTICAVCCLTQQQAFAGQIANTRMHLNGLITLVQAGGGLQSSTLNPKTRRFILLTDLATSITLQKKFHFAPPLQSNHLNLYFGPASPSTSTYAYNLSTRLFNFTEAAELSQRARDLFWGLRNLSLLLEDIRAGRTSPDTKNAEDLQFTDRVEALERLAHCLWYTEPSKTPLQPLSTTTTTTTNNPPNQNPSTSPHARRRKRPLEQPLLSSPPPANTNTNPATIFALLGHATLIYIYTTLRELPAQLGMLKLVSTRATALLERMSALQQNLLLGTFQDLMVWIMFVVGSVAPPREKVVLAKMVSRVLLVSRCESVESILEASQRFLWPEVRGGEVSAVGLVGGGDGEEEEEECADVNMVFEGEAQKGQGIGP